MSAISGQPIMGQPNTNGNTGLAPVNAQYTAPVDRPISGITDPYPNTTGLLENQSNKSPAGLGKGV
jgi:hypothetical protein